MYSFLTKKKILELFKDTSPICRRCIFFPQKLTYHFTKIRFFHKLTIPEAGCRAMSYKIKSVVLPDSCFAKECQKTTNCKDFQLWSTKYTSQGHLSFQFKNFLKCAVEVCNKLNTPLIQYSHCYQARLSFLAPSTCLCMHQHHLKIRKKQNDFKRNTPRCMPNIQGYLLFSVSVYGLPDVFSA